MDTDKKFHFHSFAKQSISSPDWFPEAEGAGLTPSRLLRQVDVEEAKTLADLVNAIFKRRFFSEDPRDVSKRGSNVNLRPSPAVAKREMKPDEVKDRVNGSATTTENQDAGGNEDVDIKRERDRERESNESGLLSAVMAALHEGLYRRKEEDGKKSRKEKSNLSWEEEIRMEWLAEKAEFLIRLRNVFGTANSVHFLLYKLFLSLVGVHP